MSLLRDLETDRLHLRLHTMDDLEELHRILYSDPDVAPPFAGSVKTIEESRERLAEKLWFNSHTGRQGWGYWSIVRRQDQKIIGLVLFGHPERVWWSRPDSYTEPAYTPLFTEIGYALGKAYWRQGYATEAARVVLDYAFRDLRVRRFEVPWYKGPRNPRSYNVYRRLGFGIKDDADVTAHDFFLTMENNIVDLSSVAIEPPGDRSAKTDNSAQVTAARGQELKSPKQIETDRLVLRGIRLSDLPRLLSLTNDSASNVRFFGTIHSFQTFRKILRFAQESPQGTRIRHGWADDSLGTWAVVRKSDDELIGHVSLGPAARAYWTVAEEDPESPYVPWEVDLKCVLDESAWDRGYDFEACRAMVGYAFKDMKLAQIVDHLDEGDSAGIVLAERLGFTVKKNLHPHYKGFVATLANPAA